MMLKEITGTKFGFQLLWKWIERFEGTIQPEWKSVLGQIRLFLKLCEIAAETIWQTLRETSQKNKRKHQNSKNKNGF